MHRLTCRIFPPTVTTLFEHVHITPSITPSIALETKFSYTRATIDLSYLSIPCDTAYYLYFHLILVLPRRDKVTSLNASPWTTTLIACHGGMIQTVTAQDRTRQQPNNLTRLQMKENQAEKEKQVKVQHRQAPTQTLWILQA